MTGRTAPAGRIRWGMPDALLVFVVANLLAVIASSMWLAFGNQITDSVGELLAAQAGLWFGFVGGSVAIVRWKGSGSVVGDLRAWGERRDVPVGLLLGIVVQVVALPVLYVVIQAVTGALDVDGAAKDLLGGRHGAGLVLLCLGVVFVAPVAEELFFRGLLLRSMERRFGTRAAVVLSSIVFAGIHFQAIQFPGLVVAGLLFGVLAVRTGRLGPAVWAHVGFNAVTAIALLVEGV